jgi:tetratricopeptide (TPR) repeat protein
MKEYAVIAEKEPGYQGIFTALGQAAFGSYLTHLEQAEAHRKAAVHLLMKALKHDPDDVDACFSLANVYIAVGTAEKALPWLKRALSLHPDSSAIHFVIASAFKMLQRYPEAAIMAQKSIQLAEPDDPFREDIEELLSELQQAVLPM